jgi:23S rRNA (cytosine1962-C5)-methyltransferase
VARFRAEPDFKADSRWAIRAALIDPAVTNAYRLLHGESDGWPGFYVDRFGDYLLGQSESPPTPAQEEWMNMTAGRIGSRGVYHKILARRMEAPTTARISPRLLAGEAAPPEFPILENGVTFLASFEEGYSPGLFLDQRENRRRWLRRSVGPGEPLGAGSGETMTVLNAFAYTCGFSVCAAKAGARVTSVDLSRKYLEWGRRNFSANGIDPAARDFIFGDVFDWLKRLQKKGRHFDAVILDPPTFSRSRESGVFQAERDYPRLLESALRSLKPGGVVLASSNTGEWKAEAFVDTLRQSATASGRRIAFLRYAAQPLDFPVSPREPAYLKTAWARFEN